MTGTTIDTPLQVTVISTGGGADLKNKTEAVTTGRQPNLITNVIGPVLAIVVRFVHLFLNTLAGGAGLIGANALGMETVLVPNFRVAVLIALSVAAVGLLKDLVTIFKGLENKYPLLTGQV